MKRRKVKQLERNRWQRDSLEPTRFSEMKKGNGKISSARSDNEKINICVGATFVRVGFEFTLSVKASAGRLRRMKEDECRSTVQRWQINKICDKAPGGRR